MNSQIAVRSGCSPPGSASESLRAHALPAERLGAGDPVGVEHECGADPREELGDAA
jgi:hypothetical protein